MRFTLEVDDFDSADMADHGPDALAQALRRVADHLGAHGESWEAHEGCADVMPVRDENGDRIGQWEVTS